jgi:hypothetical protein
VVAAFTVLITLAARERDDLRESIAMLAPRAARVQEQQNAGLEAASALDPAAGPLDLLLALTRVPGASDVTLLQVDFSPADVLLRAHASSASTALQYAQLAREAEELADWQWEAPPPELAADESAVFEMKGTNL